MALDAGVPAGYRDIRIAMDIEADCSDRELDELLEFAREHSPVCNTVIYLRAAEGSRLRPSVPDTGSATTLPRPALRRCESHARNCSCGIGLAMA
jgi:hypothetical protein